MRIKTFIALFSTVFLSLTAVSMTQADTAAPQPIDFQKTIVPILKNSCFACHMASTNQPGMSEKANKAIANAMENFAMAEKFPFPCDQPVDKQLKHLEKSLSKGFMPPDDQAQLKLGYSLSDKDRKTLLAWVAQVKKAKK